MARPVLFERHANQIAWSTAGTISEELSPKPFSITSMFIVLKLIATTTSATNYNDLYERVISRLSLTGGTKTFFDISQMRLFYHASRFWGFGPRRQSPIADSITTGDAYFLYCFHFGVAPIKADPRTGMIYYDPLDLTAGIPPVSAGNLNLGGSFAANSAMGSNVTITDGDMDIYLCGWRPDDGDAPSAFQPAMIPVWGMQSPTLSATSSAFATEHSIPTGDFLHSIMMLLTNGTNDPRDDSVLNSLELYNQADSQSLFKFGGQAGAVADYQAAEMLLQFNPAWPIAPSDNVTTAMDSIASGGTAGTIQVTGPTKDSGLVPIPLWRLARNPYGLDLRRVGTGDLKLRYGVADATGVAMHLLYRRYQQNPLYAA